MPVQMRYRITQAGEIHLVRPDGPAHGALGGEHHVQCMAGLVKAEIAHFRYMLAPDDAAETGERLACGIRDAHYAAQIILPEQVAA